MVKITSPIVASSVSTEAVTIQQMSESISRPAVLTGSTYKIKTPLSEHALYVTINNVVLNTGNKHEATHPFEIFINSKSMEHFQWIVALTRIVSAVFRKGGDCAFLVEELRSVFDPKGGYFKKGGKYAPSLVSEIGDVIETHLQSIGLIKPAELDKHQQDFIKAQKEKYNKNDTIPPEAVLCDKCQTRAVVIMDGCKTCLNCGDSKCG